MKAKYRDLQQQLDEILAKLQDSELDIDEAIILYKNGQKVIAQLETHLETAKNTVRELQAAPSAKSVARPATKKP